MLHCIHRIGSSAPRAASYLLPALLVAIVPLSGCSNDEGASGGTGGGGSTVSRGTGGARDSDAAQGTGGAAEPKEDFGEGDGRDVVMIGDSYMNYLIIGLQKSLESVSGRTYRKYGVPGAFMLDGAIPNQYVGAVSEDPDIQTVVMTGGGNDILASTCDGACEPLIDEVLARMWSLKDEMGADGVRDLVIVGYGYTSSAGDSRRGPALRDALDYWRGIIAESCRKDGPPPRCHFVDPVDELAGKVSGTHPTPEGFDVLGKVVWDRMQAEGIRR